MEMLLMAFTMTLLGVAVSAVLFGAATRNEREAEAKAAADVALAPSEFFADNPRLDSPPVSVEVLLMQIEKHVRAEKDAAESFTSAPTVEALHVRSASPFAQ
jgi:hypothetical protein